MKFIKLFENFDQNNNSPDLIFSWLPLDKELNNPIHATIPEELTLDELVKFCNEATNAQEIERTGKFLAFKKSSNGGITQYMVESISPLIFESVIFDKNFEELSRIGGLEPSSLGAFAKGSSMLRTFGIFGKK